jgi:hypothetical protein
MHRHKDHLVEYTILTSPTLLQHHICYFLTLIRYAFEQAITALEKVSHRNLLPAQVKLEQVTVMLQCCTSYVTVVIQWYYSGATVVLQGYCSGVTVVLQWCYRGMTVVLQWIEWLTASFCLRK